MLIKKYWLHCFLFLLIADAISLAIDSKTAHFILKFLLMPVLITGLLNNKGSGHEKNWRVILAGLVTAWAGDVLLLFSEERQQFFILGLVCFLCTHLAYIVYFSRYHKNIFLFIKQKQLITVIAALYAALLLIFLWSGLGSLVIPVVIYTIVITMMVLQSFAAREFLPRKIGNGFVLGAVAFVVSDSLLAIDKFHESFLLSNSAIILTYGLAQLLIVHATIRNSDERIITATA